MLLTKIQSFGVLIGLAIATWIQGLVAYFSSCSYVYGDSAQDLIDCGNRSRVAYAELQLLFTFIFAVLCLLVMVVVKAVEVQCCQTLTLILTLAQMPISL